MAVVHVVLRAGAVQTLPDVLRSLGEHGAGVTSIDTTHGVLELTLPTVRVGLLHALPFVACSRTVHTYAACPVPARRAA